MDQAELYQRLTPIFRDTFDLDDLELTPELTAEDVPEWDSLSHIRLIVAVEMEFNVQLNASQAAELENVGQFVALIEDLVGR